PGNAGIAALAECVPIQSEDLSGLLNFAKKEKIDLTIVGPEAPLVEGIVSLFERAGLPVFGPSKGAAQLEGSKIFTKEFLQRHEIPTGDFAVFESFEPAQKYIEKKGAPIVVKADGLAAGKGVFVCSTKEEALAALKFLFVEKGLGEAGKRVLIEECLKGIETSFIVLASGREALPLATSKDHKRAYDDDRGPNTGGMGTVSPSPYLNEDLQKEVMDRIILPTLKGMEEEENSFNGVLYAGLMLTREGPKVLEYNVRFGDPEIQVILPRLENDLLDLIEACMKGKLKQQKLLWRKELAVCVVMASGGYPGKYEKGKVISGLDQVGSEEGIVFHAGTVFKGDQVVTAGGRVLGITSLGKDLEEARQKAYRAVSKISWDGAFYRKDIGL
ncbi:MAG: phosphoribosylamine--glycine ligase, partial [bacterium]|nr:phosphoribosylamine--glycine ligase [bacterium]